MALKPFRKIVTSNKDVNLLQDTIAELWGAVQSNPLLQGHLMKAVPLATGTNLVSHGLGRAPQSFLWGNPSAAVSLSYGVTPDVTKYLAIVASAPCTVDLYPF